MLHGGGMPVHLPGRDGRSVRGRCRMERSSPTLHRGRRPSRRMAVGQEARQDQAMISPSPSWKESGPKRRKATVPAGKNRRRPAWRPADRAGSGSPASRSCGRRQDGRGHARTRRGPRPAPDGGPCVPVPEGRRTRRAVPSASSRARSAACSRSSSRSGDDGRREALRVAFAGPGALRGRSRPSHALPFMEVLC